MVRIDNGSEMSLAKQYFDDLLVSIKQQDCSFSTTKKKKIKSQHTREGFFIIRSDNYILAGNIFSTPT